MSNDPNAVVLSNEQWRQGIAANNRKLEDSLKNQLYWIYERIFTTGINHVNFYLPFPKSAITYLAEHILIAVPSNANLSNFYLTTSRRKNNYTYIFENLRDNIFGAKLSLFTTPGADPDVTTAGDQSQYMGAMPINIEFQGQEQVQLTIRGAGLSAIAHVDFMIMGHMENRGGL